MNKLINRTGDYLAFSGAGIFLFLSALTLCDVIGRRFFNSPIVGTIEIVELGMAMAAFSVMPRAFLSNSHVSAQFINSLAVGGFGVFLIGFRGILMISTMAVLAYATTVKAIEHISSGRVTIELEMPFYPFWLIIAVCAWGSALAALTWMLRALHNNSTALVSSVEEEVAELMGKKNNGR
jgi:TRAP-type C4-dicarboxylate transport system permease small subunit